MYSPIKGICKCPHTLRIGLLKECQQSAKKLRFSSLCLYRSIAVENNSLFPRKREGKFMLLIETCVKARPQSNAAPRLELVARDSSDPRNSCWIQSGLVFAKVCRDKDDELTKNELIGGSTTERGAGGGVGQGVGLGWHSGILTW